MHEISAQDETHACHVCQELCLSRRSMSNHMRAHCEREGFSAHRCTTRCTAQSSSQSPVNTKRGRPKMGTCKCISCGKGFRSPEKLRSHTLHFHFDEKPYSCTHCAKCFRWESSMKLHLGTHYRQYNNKVLLTSNSTKLKRKSVSGQHDGPEIPDSTTDGNPVNVSINVKSDIIDRRLEDVSVSTSCVLCGKNFRNSASLKNHMDIHHSKPSHRCPTCNKRFRYERDLKIHKRRHRSRTVGSHISHWCPSCQHWFTKKKWTIHKNMCKTIRKVTAKKNKDRNVANKSHQLQNKNGTERNSKQVQCQDCGKYLSYASVWIHKHTHCKATYSKHKNAGKANRKPATKKKTDDNVATSMENKIDRANESSEHVRDKCGVKRNSKRIQCDECGKYLSSASMWYHKRTHTGKKPFTCNICDKRFAAKFNCKNHEARHSASKQFLCDTCGKRFKKKQHLKHHKKHDHQHKEGRQ